MKGDEQAAEMIEKTRAMIAKGLNTKQVLKELGVEPTVEAIEAVAYTRFIMENENKKDDTYPFLGVSGTRQDGASPVDMLQSFAEQMNKDERVYARVSQGLQEQMYSQLRLWHSISGEPVARI